jgi:hypothetical protein
MLYSLGRVLGIEPVGARGEPYLLPDVPHAAEGRLIRIHHFRPVYRGLVSILLGKLEPFHQHLGCQQRFHGHNM